MIEGLKIISPLLIPGVVIVLVLIWAMLKVLKQTPKSSIEYKIRTYVSIIGLAVLFSILCYSLYNVKTTNRNLQSKGVIYDVSVGRRGRYAFKYYFYPNGFRQEGASGSALKRNIGDTVSVIYIPNDYSVNKPAFNVN